MTNHARSTPRNNAFVTLCSALTWIAYDHAREIEDTIQWLREHGLRDDEVMQLLTNTWRDLRGYAQKGKISIRATALAGGPERALTLDELRNHKHYGWEFHNGRPVERLNFNPINFHGGFRDRVEELSGGLVHPVVDRTGLVAYKKSLHKRAGRRPVSPDVLADLEYWLQSKLDELGRKSGIKEPLRTDAKARFPSLPNSHFENTWRSEMHRRDWQIYGRPKTSRRKLKHARE